MCSHSRAALTRASRTYLLASDASIFKPPRPSFATTLSFRHSTVLALCKASLYHGPIITKAPAKDGENANKMRQKSLMSFFGKAPTTLASTSSSSHAKPANARAAPPGPKQAANASKGPIERVLDDTSSDPLGSKVASHSSVSGPQVDVDMLSVEEHASQAKSHKPMVRSIRTPARSASCAERRYLAGSVHEDKTQDNI